MKIICIGRNYTDHINELVNEKPEYPVVFMKPDTSILNSGFPFVIPEFSNDVHHELEVVVKINKVGKYIQPKFASKYYNQIGLGIDFTARDLQRDLKEKGLPWEIAKGFDGSAAMGEFISKQEFESIQNINFHLDINSKTVQQDNTSNMIFSVDKIIAYASQFFTLKIGDIIFTGTPAGVGPVKIDDHLEGYLENRKLLDFNVR